ncbi:MAG: amidohydrolase family protein [Pirellulales bacterium]|nr:amidohydrolase family protein [Pirellulales bacterium]
MIIDCHTHWSMDQWPQNKPDPETWWDVPGRHGIDHAIVLPLAALTDDTKLQLENDRIHQVCRESNGRMIPFCSVKPSQGDPAVAELQRCTGKFHTRGIKIHPWLQGTCVNTSHMDRICEVAGDSGIPLLFHDGTPCVSLPSQIGLLARRHPKTTMILGHLGLMEHWREAISVMRKESNIWGCLCGPHVAAIKEILQRCDRSRLLWGSDYGFGNVDPIDYRLDLLKIQNLKHGDMEKILDHNPKRLLSL